MLILINLSCNVLQDPGSLGYSDFQEMKCSSSEVENEIEALSRDSKFKVNTSDSTILNWWVENGYEFLNFKCLKINKRLYMLTITNDDDSESTLSIRSYYNRNKQEWMFAKEFSEIDLYRSKKDFQLLINNFSTCK